MLQGSGAPDTCPSNRKTSGSPSEGSQVIGIDRLAVSYPCRGVDEDPGNWEREVRDMTSEGPRRTLSRQDRIDGASVFVSVKEVPESREARWWGKVEVNPSRVVDPDGVGLATIAELRPVLALVRRVAERQSEPKVSDGDWRIKRLDVARDFTGVEDAGRLIRGLGPVHRPHSRRNLVHADPRRNRAQTLMVGSGAGVVRLYDKACESNGLAPEGTVRWEAESRSKWCSRLADIERVRDLCGPSLERLALDRWEWSAMGAEVASSVGRLVRAAEADGISERERAFFLGWLIAEAGGVPIRGLGKATVAKYRRLQRSLGIVAPTDLADQVAVVSRLDWESGREVQRVA